MTDRVWNAGLKRFGDVKHPISPRIIKRFNESLFDSKRCQPDCPYAWAELYAKLLGCLVTHWSSLLRAGLLTKLSLHQILKRVEKAIGNLEDSCDESNPNDVATNDHILLSNVSTNSGRAPNERRNREPWNSWKIQHLRLTKYLWGVSPTLAKLIQLGFEHGVFRVASGLQIGQQVQKFFFV